MPSCRAQLGRRRSGEAQSRQQALLPPRAAAATGGCLGGVCRTHRRVITLQGRPGGCGDAPEPCPRRSPAPKQKKSPGERRPPHSPTMRQQSHAKLSAVSSSSYTCSLLESESRTSQAVVCRAGRSTLCAPEASRKACSASLKPPGCSFSRPPRAPGRRCSLLLISTPASRSRAGAGVLGISARGLGAPKASSRRRRHVVVGRRARPTGTTVVPSPRRLAPARGSP